MATIALVCVQRKSDQADTSMLAKALAYADRGWPVIPLHTPTPGGCSCGRAECGSPGKHPRTQNGLKEATADQNQIIQWKAKALGISFATLRRAQDRLGVIKRPGGFRQSWLLELPRVAQNPQSCSGSTMNNTAEIDQPCPEERAKAALKLTARGR